MELTKKIFERLSNNKCTDSPLYITLLDKVLNDPMNPPSPKDLYNAAVANYKRKEFSKAEERFNRAINISNDDNLKQIKPYQNVVLENLDLDINEKLIYTLFNIIDQDNKFLIITSSNPITEINFEFSTSFIALANIPAILPNPTIPHLIIILFFI